MCRAIWNTISDESFHSSVLPEIDFKYLTIELENKEAEYNFCNMKFTEVEENFGSSVPAFLCGCPRTLRGRERKVYL